MTLLSTTTTNNAGPQINSNGWIVWQGSEIPNIGTYLWNGSSIRKLSPGTSVDFGPQINNTGQVVWPSRESLQPLGFGDTDDEIFLWNGSSVQQLTNENGPNELFPRMNNAGQVVWEHWDGLVHSIYLWNGSFVQTLSTGNTASTDNRHPQIDNAGHVVWQHFDGSAWQINFWNGSAVQQLVTNGFENFNPQINDAGQVVWAGGVPGHHNIYLWNGSSIQQLTVGDPDDQYPQINSSGQVAWVRGNGMVSGNSQWDVWFWNGASMRRITYTASEINDLRLNAMGQIVWTHQLPVGRAVYLWNRAAVQPLADDPSWKQEPAINDAGQVVWAGWDGNTDRIYLYTPAPPAPPSGLTASVVSSTQVNLCWTANSNDETQFAIWRHGVNAAFSRVGVVPPNITSFTDSGLTPNARYTYEVRATNDVGASPWSNQVTIFPSSGPPAAPSSLTAAVISATQIGLNWTDNSDNETQFAIWRRVGGGAFVRVGVVLPNTTSFTDSGLTPNARYTYEVRATNDVGASPWSNQVTIFPSSSPPAAPSNLAATAASSTQVNLTWTDNSDNETQFAIWRRIGGGTFTRVGVVLPNTTSFNDTGLAPSSTYTYEVRATNDVGASGWSNLVTASTPP